MKRNGTSPAGSSSSSSRESIALREEVAARASRSAAAADGPATTQYHRVVSEKAEVRTDVNLQMEIRNRVNSAASTGVVNGSAPESMDISVITSLMMEYERDQERLKQLIMQPVAARRLRRAVDRRLGKSPGNMFLHA